MVLLFISTKDRWKWKKILFFFIGIPLVLCVLIGGGYWAYITIANRPHLEHTFWDIPISASKSDVKFLKGEPPSIAGDQWTYHAGDDYYGIRFRENKIESITFYSCEELRDSRIYPYIQGILYGQNYEEVIQTFGSPSDVSTSKDDLTRVLSFKKYGVFCQLTKNKVVAYGIYNPRFGPIKVESVSSVGFSEGADHGRGKCVLLIPVDYDPFKDKKEQQKVP